MKTFRVISALAVVVVVAGTRVGAAPQQGTSTKSLYERLGGYDAIAAIVNDFGRRWDENPQLKRLYPRLQQ